MIPGTLSRITKLSSRRSLMADFMGGVDPSGARTFQYGLTDIDKPMASRSLRRGVATAGGVVGGSLIIPPAIGAILGAGKGFIQQPGGIGKRLATAGREAIRTAKRPYGGLYHAVKAKRTIKEVIAGKPVSPDKFKSLDKLIQTRVPKEYAPKVPKMRQVLLQRGAKALAGNFPETLRTLNKELTGEIALGVGTLGLSGAVSGGSAYIQYDKGRKTAKQFREMYGKK